MRLGKHDRLGSSVLGGALLLACASLLTGRAAHGDASDIGGGAHKVYGAIPPDQIEHLSTADRIKSMAASGSMMGIWETLEHGERVECLDCIPSVEPLLYDPNPRTREIAAWWLRKRVFGVFGKGEVYERTLQTLISDTNPTRRTYAAYALGEFLAAPGIDACATAIERDGDPNVRAAAARALGRLNHEGHGALGRAMSDADSRVKLAALKSAARVNTFSDATAVGRLTSDADASVRRGAAEVLGVMRNKDSVDALMAIARTDADANVRNAAVHSLGALHDERARPLLEEIRASDADGFVRDQADIALRRL
jgi:hypothetical protein